MAIDLRARVIEACGGLVQGLRMPDPTGTVNQGRGVENPDFLIVGGGTAGSVLASRLSEDGATRVLLIEAGQDTPPGATPADIADTFPSSSLNRGYFWPELKAERVIGEARRPYPQARVMGGGSSVMGMWALRGVPADFDNWAKAGAQGWAWNDVVKFYRQIENDEIGRREVNARARCRSRGCRSSNGRPSRKRWSGGGATRRSGWSTTSMKTAATAFSRLPLSQGGGQRASSAHIYLTEAVRRRPNFKIMADTRVTALKLAGGHVEAVELEQGGQRRTISARQVILSAGGIHSPAMLLRSGIGPAADLQKLGIAVQVDRPGVGANLQNHPYLHFALTISAGPATAGGFASVRAGGLAALVGRGGRPGRRSSGFRHRPGQSARLRRGARHGGCRAVSALFARPGDARDAGYSRAAAHRFPVAVGPARCAALSQKRALHRGAAVRRRGQPDL